MPLELMTPKGATPRDVAKIKSDGIEGWTPLSGLVRLTPRQ